jgi:hypothetical protein
MIVFCLGVGVIGLLKNTHSLRMESLLNAVAFDTSRVCGSLLTIMSRAHFFGYVKALILSRHGCLHSWTLRRFRAHIFGTPQKERISRNKRLSQFPHAIKRSRLKHLQIKSIHS